MLFFIFSSTFFPVNFLVSFFSFYLRGGLAVGLARRSVLSATCVAAMRSRAAWLVTSLMTWAGARIMAAGQAERRQRPQRPVVGGWCLATRDSSHHGMSRAPRSWTVRRLVAPSSVVGRSCTPATVAHHRCLDHCHAVNINSHSLILYSINQYSGSYAHVASSA